MRIRNTVIALVLLAIVGGYALIIGYYSKPAEAQKLLNLKPDEIAKIVLEYPSRATDKVVEVERKKGGEWRITKPIGADADQTVVNNLARAIADCEINKTVEEKAADLKPFGLAPPDTIVTVATFSGKTLPGIEVGKVTPIGFNAYIKTADKTAILLTSSAFPSGMNKTADQLRDRDIMTFKVDDVKRFTIAKDNGEFIEVVRAGDKWRIDKPGSYLADPTQVRELLSALVNAKVADFITDTPASVSQYGLEKPHLTVTAYVGKGNEQQSLLFGFKQNEQGKDGIYVRRGERTPVYTVHQYIESSVDKSLLELRDKTVMSFAPSQVESAEVQVASGGFTLKRAPSGKWDLVEGGKTTPADVPVAERFLDQLRDLKGVSIVADPMPNPQPFGLDQPAVQVTLTGKDGKPIGTYKLAKITVKQAGPPIPGESAAPRTEYYANSSAGKAVYSLSDFSFSQLNKPAFLFRARAAATPAPTPAK
jgi:Domain of unknown function (DUF4340)